MSRQAQIVDIFLSSPSDVAEERKFVVDMAREWNSLRSNDTRVFLNVLTWEDAVAPDFGDRAQSVINEAVGDDYDWYVGIMWGRFGSPTGAAESGTVEEYERALDRYRHGEDIHIAMLFKTNDIPQAQLNGAQFDQIQDFKKRFAEDGGFYGEFDTDDRLRRLLNRIFEHIARSQSGPPVPPAAPSPSKPTGPKKRARGAATAEDSISDSRLSGSDELALGSNIADLGLFEINDRLQEVAAAQTGFFEDLTSINHETTREISEATEEMERLVSFGQAETSKIKPIISRIAGAMWRSASFLEERLPKFREKNDELSGLTEQGFDVSSDFGRDNSHFGDFYNAVQGVVGMLSQNRAAIDGMMESVSDLPRMSVEFNHSKKRLLSMNRELRDEVDRLYESLSSILRRYERTDVAAASTKADPKKADD